MKKKEIMPKSIVVKQESVNDFINRYKLTPLPVNFPSEPGISGGTISLNSSLTISRTPTPHTTLQDAYMIDVNKLEVGTKVIFSLLEYGSITKKPNKVELLYKVEKYDDINSKLILQK